MLADSLTIEPLELRKLQKIASVNTGGKFLGENIAVLRQIGHVSNRLIPHSGDELSNDFVV